MKQETIKVTSNPLLKAIGATSWGDAAVCLMVYTFLLMFIMSFTTVVVTFVLSFVSGQMVD